MSSVQYNSCDGIWGHAVVVDEHIRDTVQKTGGTYLMQSIFESLSDNCLCEEVIPAIMARGISVEHLSIADSMDDAVPAPSTLLFSMRLISSCCPLFTSRGTFLTSFITALISVSRVHCMRDFVRVALGAVPEETVWDWKSVQLEA